MSHDPAPFTLDDIRFSQHGWRRLRSRGVRYSGVVAAFEHGRIVFERGACIRLIGRQEVARAFRKGFDISQHEGVHVVCCPETDIVITLFRNKDLQVRPPARRRCSRRSA